MRLSKRNGELRWRASRVGEGETWMLYVMFSYCTGSNHRGRLQRCKRATGKKCGWVDERVQKANVLSNVRVGETGARKTTMGVIGEVWGNTLRSVGSEVCRKVNVLAEDPRSVDRQTHGPTAIPRRVSRHRCRRLWSNNRPDQHERSRTLAQLRRVPWSSDQSPVG